MVTDRLRCEDPAILCLGFSIRLSHSGVNARRGFERSHYQWKAQTGHIGQAFLTMMVLNLKRVVLIVAGVPLR